MFSEEHTLFSLPSVLLLLLKPRGKKHTRAHTAKTNGEQKLMYAKMASKFYSLFRNTYLFNCSSEAIDQLIFKKERQV